MSRESNLEPSQQNPSDCDWSGRSDSPSDSHALVGHTTLAGMQEQLVALEHLQQSKLLLLHSFSARRWADTADLRGRNRRMHQEGLAIWIDGNSSRSVSVALLDTRSCADSPVLNGDFGGWTSYPTINESSSGLRNSIPHAQSAPLKVR